MKKLKIIADADFLPDLRKSIHYISWTPRDVWSRTGYTRVSYVDALIRRNLPWADPEEFFRTVDSSNETGTLYPEISITVMPSSGQPYPDEEIYRHFGDAMIAQNRYIYAKHVMFDMRSYAYINPRTNKPDNEEYVRMICHNCILNADAGYDFYVIMLPRAADGLKGEYFEIAGQAETDALKLKS